MHTWKSAKHSTNNKKKNSHISTLKIEHLLIKVFLPILILKKNCYSHRKNRFKSTFILTMKEKKLIVNKICE